MKQLDLAESRGTGRGGGSYKGSPGAAAASFTWPHKVFGPKPGLVKACGAFLSLLCFLGVLLCFVGVRRLGGGGGGSGPISCSPVLPRRKRSRANGKPLGKSCLLGRRHKAQDRSVSAINEWQDNPETAHLNLPVQGMEGPQPSPPTRDFFF